MQVPEGCRFSGFGYSYHHLPSSTYEAGRIQMKPVSMDLSGFEGLQGWPNVSDLIRKTKEWHKLNDIAEKQRQALAKVAFAPTSSIEQYFGGWIGILVVCIASSLIVIGFATILILWRRVSTMQVIIATSRKNVVEFSAISDFTPVEQPSRTHPYHLRQARRSQDIATQHEPASQQSEAFGAIVAVDMGSTSNLTSKIASSMSKKTRKK